VALQLLDERIHFVGREPRNKRDNGAIEFSNCTWLSSSASLEIFNDFGVVLLWDEIVFEMF
jgi:hypothetical protein